ncbi:MAG: hypothetical protein DRQ89_13850 [Epsilonproteobacteria bacterium]|nr:MAG: hypothetical protein DRQ89_13850 [Campylobacterota bacterium]
MSAQIRFFNKNKIDLSLLDSVTITITDATATNTGQDYVDFMRNRNNTSAWLTTDSNDAANTEIEVLLGDTKEVSNIILVSHNLKAYTIQYWNGSAYVDFSTIISETTNTETTNLHTFTTVTTDQIKIIITGTQTADADKQIKQLIITDEVASGQLEGWPIIKRPRHSTNKKISTMLSGKVNVVESVGGFGMDLTVRNWNIDADLDLVEEIYFGNRGVLVWLSGGDETQFSRAHIGYRKEDLFLMRVVNDYTPEFRSGIYSTGIKVNMKLRESID